MESLIWRIVQAISNGKSAEEIAAHFETAGTPEEIFHAYCAAKIFARDVLPQEGQS